MVRCEVCWFGGPDVSSESFRSVGGVTLCGGCAEADTEGPVVVAGHAVRFLPEGWVCSCGRVYEVPVFLFPRVVEAVPNLVAVMARLHVQACEQLSAAGGK